MLCVTCHLNWSSHLGIHKQTNACWSITRSQTVFYHLKICRKWELWSLCYGHLLQCHKWSNVLLGGETKLTLENCGAGGRKVPQKFWNEVTPPPPFLKNFQTQAETFLKKFGIRQTTSLSKKKIPNINLKKQFLKTFQFGHDPPPPPLEKFQTEADFFFPDGFPNRGSIYLRLLQKLICQKTEWDPARFSILV
jgi:hypothetical protein